MKLATVAQSGAPEDNRDEAIWLRLRASDTWFFRELRAHGGPGGQPLSSLFPPSGRSLLGALLQFLHGAPQAKGAQQAAQQALAQSLRLSGPWLHWQPEGAEEGAEEGSMQGPQTADFLYPCPAHLGMGQDQTTWATLQPGPAYASDLGHMRLPIAPPNWHSAAACWLTEADWLAARMQRAPHACVQGEGMLWHSELHQSMARDPLSGHAQDGALYSALHVRPRPELSLVLKLALPPSAQLASARAALQELAQEAQRGALLRLGAEGRCAHLSLWRGPLPLLGHSASAGLDLPLLEGPHAAPGARGCWLQFLTPADFGGDFKPANFKLIEYGGAQAWAGFADAASGVYLVILSMAGRSVLRQGGWRTRARSAQGLGVAREARSLLAPGAVWFCHVLQGDATALARLQLGAGRELGRGALALGPWHDA